MDFISSHAVDLSIQLSRQLTEYQYRALVKKFGWDLDSPPNTANDQFVSPQTLYVIAQNGYQQVAGGYRGPSATPPSLL